MPPPARAISSYGTPVTFCSYSPARHPANGRWVWQSTRPGRSAHPVASMWMFASLVGSSAEIRPCSTVIPPGSRLISPARLVRR
jgi:hypothetical protein